MTTTRGPYRTTEPLPPLLGPNLPNAACRGDDRHSGAEIHGPLWDATTHGETATQRAERHAKATTICLSCPALTACRTARETNPELGEGIYAGQLYGPSKQCRCGAPLPAGTARQRVWCTRTCRDTHRTPARSTEPAPVHDRVCECGTAFTTTQPKQVFCGHACRYRHGINRNSARHRRDTAADTARRLTDNTTCRRAGCGDPISASRRARRSPWCSEKCRRAGVRDRARNEAA